MDAFLGLASQIRLLRIRTIPAATAEVLWVPKGSDVPVKSEEQNN